MRDGRFDAVFVVSTLFGMLGGLFGALMFRTIGERMSTQRWPGQPSMALPSTAGSGSSAARMPVSRRSAGLRLFHLSLKSAAVMALATARPRIARAADRPRRRR